ncbi:MAG: hypothetical protein JSS20_11865, partial [Proteobacteria bacterium]|nr:hypothetical protein [Pseudomonadota bacterium]
MSLKDGVLLLIGMAGITLPVAIERGAGGGAVLTIFLPVLAIPMGSAVLLAIHALTGGRWGDALRTPLATAAALAPVVLILLLPIGFAAHSLYPWAANTAAAAHTDVLQLYLNVPFAICRTAIIVLAFACLLWVALRTAAGPIAAAAALIAYGFAISFASIDWVMSLEPRWASSDFPALTAIGQVWAALAFAAIMRRNVAPDAVSEDLAQLLIAGLLGVTYLAFMQFLVIWSGNLPDKMSYFVLRDVSGWNSILLAAFVLAVVMPFFLLIPRRARQNPRAVAIGGAGILVGYFL